MADEKMNIKKQSEEMDRQDKKIGKYREELRAKCPHTHNGELTLVPYRNGNDENNNRKLVFICRQCKKIVRFTEVSDTELDNAFDVFDRACDVIKIAVNPNNENDMKTLDRVAKFQYRLRDIKSYYHAAVSHGNKRRDNGNRRNNRNDNSLWNKPTTLN